MHFGPLFSDGNSKDEQGDWGEFRVNNKILRIKNQLGECYLYRDIYIESNDVTYQIDHLLVHPKGIFVIETKAVSGLIYGSIDKGMWFSNVYGKKISFLNPLFHNKKHIDALKDIFGESFPYHSVIVFTERNKPKKMPNNVISLKELQEYLLNFESEQKLSPVQMHYFKVNLDEIIKNKAELRKKHKEQLKYK